MMNAKEFIEQHLQDCQYGSELSQEAEKAAKENGLVVVFGASDDLCELRGAIDDEAGCYNGGEIYLSPDGEIICNDEERFTIYVDDVTPRKADNLIEALWDSDGYSWTYKTEIPHETFEVYDDGGKYCLGIVFSISDLRPKLTNYERIRNMSLDEMAKFLDKITDVCGDGSIDALDCYAHGCPLASDTDMLDFVGCPNIKKWLEKVAE